MRTWRKNIFPPTKQGTEEGDFGLGGGMLIHANVRQVRKSGRCVHKPYSYIRITRGVQAQSKTDPKVQ